MLQPGLCMPGKSLPTSHPWDSSSPWRFLGARGRTSQWPSSLAFVTGLPLSKGHQVILTVVDWFSKAAHFIPLPKFLSAAETSEILVQHVVCFHGIPRDIVSDRGSHFFCQVWKAFCSALGASAVWCV